MKGVDEVASVATSGASEDENTKVAEYAQKAQEFAQRAPTEARSAAAPQVADSAPTGLHLLFLVFIRLVPSWLSSLSLQLGESTLFLFVAVRTHSFAKVLA